MRPLPQRLFLRLEKMLALRLHTGLADIALLLALLPLMVILCTLGPVRVSWRCGLADSAVCLDVFSGPQNWMLPDRSGMPPARMMLPNLG